MKLTKFISLMFLVNLILIIFLLPAFAILLILKLFLLTTMPWIIVFIPVLTILFIMPFFIISKLIIDQNGLYNKKK